MRAFVLVTTLCAATAVAQDTEPPAPEEKPAAEEKKEEEGGSLFDKSKWVVRGGVNFDVGGAINLGGTSAGARASVGVHGGVGYFIVPRLSLDVDARFMLRLAPGVGVDLLEFTPGARWRPIDQIQLRVGVPIPIIPQAGVGILGGVAYVQPLGGRVSLVVGVDYTYYFTDYWRSVAPQGRIEFHGGVQAYF